MVPLLLTVPSPFTVDINAGVSRAAARGVVMEPVLVVITPPGIFIHNGYRKVLAVPYAEIRAVIGGGLSAPALSSMAADWMPTGLLFPP